MEDIGITQLISNSGDTLLSIGVMMFFLNYFIKLSEKQWKFYNDEIKAREEKYAAELEKRDKEIIAFTNRVVTVISRLIEALSKTDSGKNINPHAVVLSVTNDET